MSIHLSWDGSENVRKVDAAWQEAATQQYYNILELHIYAKEPWQYFNSSTDLKILFW
jgi:hypothetical protein